MTKGQDVYSGLFVVLLTTLSKETLAKTYETRAVRPPKATVSDTWKFKTWDMQWMACAYHSAHSAPPSDRQKEGPFQKPPTREIRKHHVLELLTQGKGGAACYNPVPLVRRVMVLQSLAVTRFSNEEPHGGKA